MHVSSYVYLMDCFTRTADVSSHQCLRSANRHLLMVPRHRRSTFGRRVFFRCESDGMELASRLTPGPCSVYRQLQIGAENSSFCGAKERLAH